MTRAANKRQFTMFRGQHLIDGTGAESADSVMLVDNTTGRIADVGPEGMVKARLSDDDVSVVDLDGRTVMPGMIDCHFHGAYEAVTCFEDYDLRRPIEESTILHARNAQRVLAAGFTSVREVGSRGLISVSVSKLIEQGVLSGPRLVPGGRILTTTGGLADGYGGWIANRDALGVIVDGPQDVVKAVREQVKHGTQCIKVEASGTGVSRYAGAQKVTMSVEEMQAAVWEARRNGRHVACHAQGTESIKNGLRAGVDTIEHGSYLDEEGANMMLENGTLFVPTLSVKYLYAHQGEASGFSAEVVGKAKQDIEAHLQSFQMAIERGIPVAVGSDSGHAFNPQAGIAIELEMMVRYGLAPMQAIVAATGTAARAIGLGSEIGTLEPGKVADFLVLGSNPIEDIALLQQPAQLLAIYQGGRLTATGESGCIAGDSRILFALRDREDAGDPHSGHDCHTPSVDA